MSKLLFDQRTETFVAHRPPRRNLHDARQFSTAEISETVQQWIVWASHLLLDPAGGKIILRIIFLALKGSKSNLRIAAYTWCKHIVASTLWLRIC